MYYVRLSEGVAQLKGLRNTEIKVLSPGVLCAQPAGLFDQAETIYCYQTDSLTKHSKLRLTKQELGHIKEKKEALDTYALTYIGHEWRLSLIELGQ
jgi:hypothetical protein